jgi:hypothetical protein
MLCVCGHRYGPEEHARVPTIPRYLMRTTALPVLEGPQPHPSFIEVFGEATFDNGDRAVAGAGDDGLIRLGNWCCSA